MQALVPVGARGDGPDHFGPDSTGPDHGEKALFLGGDVGKRYGTQSRVIKLGDIALQFARGDKG